jgi:hypothetical protein|tara:strand:+ start:18029 stop:18445 length:417 start_codon:yes stop_codon:yes gene_type:complete
VKFNKIINSALDSTSLKKVRFRTDPKNKDNLSITGEYEGYVIEEMSGVLRIMMTSPDAKDDIMDISPEEVEPAEGRTLEDFKRFALEYLHSKNKCDCAEATHDNIISAGDIQHLEAFLKEQGVENNEFIQLIKLFLMS